MCARQAALHPGTRSGSGTTQVASSRIASLSTAVLPCSRAMVAAAVSVSAARGFSVASRRTSSDSPLASARWRERSREPRVCAHCGLHMFVRGFDDGRARLRSGRDSIRWKPACRDARRCCELSAVRQQLVIYPRGDVECPYPERDVGARPGLNSACVRTGTSAADPPSPRASPRHR